MECFDGALDAGGETVQLAEDLIEEGGWVIGGKLSSIGPVGSADRS